MTASFVTRKSRELQMKSVFEHLESPVALEHILESFEAAQDASLFFSLSQLDGDGQLVVEELGAEIAGQLRE